MAKEIKGYKMSVEPEAMSGKYYDMSAREGRMEDGQHYMMSADDGEDTGHMKHAEHKQTTHSKL